MVDAMFLQNTFKSMIDKMRPPVTNHGPRTSIPAKYVRFNKLIYHFTSVGPSSYSFYLLRDIVYSHQNIFIPIYFRKWPHEINTP